MLVGDLATVSAAVVMGKTTQKFPNIAAQAGLRAAVTTHLIQLRLAD